MAKRRVVVRGGGHNLYFVSDTSGTYYVRKGSVWGSGMDIGKTKSLADALGLIKTHSGRDIESIN